MALWQGAGPPGQVVVSRTLGNLARCCTLFAAAQATGCASKCSASTGTTTTTATVTANAPLSICTNMKSAQPPNHTRKLTTQQTDKQANSQTHKRITNKQVVLQPLFIAQSVHVNCGLHFIIDANCRYGSDIGSHQPTASDREPLKQSQNKNPNKVKNKNKEKKSTVKVINKNNKTGNDYNIVYNFWAFVVMAAHICDCLVAAGCYRL